MTRLHEDAGSWTRRDVIGALVAGGCLAALQSLRAGEVSPGRAKNRSASMVLSESGCGRATGYAETNKIVTLAGKTHVAWLDSKGKEFLVRVRTLDRATGQWSPATTVGRAYDNHGGPALTVDSAGHLHIVYYPHHHPFRYRRSKKPNDASSWEEEVSFGSRCTYPTLLCGPHDTLYLTCRESGPDPWVLNLYTKQRNGPWEGPRTIIRAEDKGYSHFQEALCWGAEPGTIHLSCRIYGGSPRRGHTVGYLRSDDSGKTWRTAAGRELALPATASTVDRIAQDREGTGVGYRSGAIAVDPEGIPHVLYGSYDEVPLPAWIATPGQDGRWHSRPVRPDLPAEWDGWGLTLPGGITFGEEGRLFVALTLIRPPNLADTTIWGHPTSEVLFLESDDRGETFRSRVLSAVDPGRPHWLPNLERPTGHNVVDTPGLIYTDGSRGKDNRAIVSNRVVWVDPGEGSG